MYNILATNKGQTVRFEDHITTADIQTVIKRAHEMAEKHPEIDSIRIAKNIGPTAWQPFGSTKSVCLLARVGGKMVIAAVNCPY